MTNSVRACDVLVSGGGPAGVAAALSAARNGARTVLIEATGCLGGMATSGNIPAFCPFTNGGPVLIRGIGLEILQALRARGGAGKGHGPEGLDWVPFDSEILKILLDDLLLEAAVRVRFFTRVCGARTDRGRIREVLTDSKAGCEEWSAPVVVDATGDGDAAVAAGAAYELGERDGRMQPATLCFAIAGIRLDEANRFATARGGEEGNPLGTWLKKEKETRLANPGDTNVNIAQDPRGMILLNYNHVFGVNGVAPEDQTRVMIEGRRIAAELLEFLRAFVPGCEGAWIARTAALPGIRETRRIVGDLVLTGDDFDHGRTREDDIAVYSYPVDRHPLTLEEARTHRMREYFTRRLPPDAWYGIPYRALLPQGLTNCLVAGRCVSCDRVMQSSLRVMPACFAMGEAAGLAAALAAPAGGDTRSVDVPALQERLRAQGAFLPPLRA